MLPVSLDCTFVIAPSVISNVYLSCVPYVASLSGLYIFDCTFGFLQRLYAILLVCFTFLPYTGGDQVEYYVEIREECCDGICNDGH